MKDLFYELVFFTVMFLVIETIVSVARWLGAPSSWFPASWYPICPKCKRRRLSLISKAPEETLMGKSRRGFYRLLLIVAKLHDLELLVLGDCREFYLCMDCGARWMKRSNGRVPWEDASAGRWDDYYQPSALDISKTSEDDGRG